MRRMRGRRTYEALTIQRGTDCRDSEGCAAAREAPEAGQRTADVCRRHGISEGTFYKWKAKYGGLEVSDARRLKALEDENAKLKKLLAEAMLDNAVLKDLNAKRW